MSAEASPRRRVKAVAVSLTHGKINAVCTAFKAGVTPSRIARHFGISQSDVRKAVAPTRSRTRSQKVVQLEDRNRASLGGPGQGIVPKIDEGDGE
jgi:hypothetical protein